MLYTECMTEHMPQSSGYPENAPSKEAFTPARVLAVGRETIRRSGALFAGREPDMIDIMRELEPVVAHELNRHNRMRKPWTGADFLPIDEKTGLILGRGTLEHPENQIILPPAAQAAMLVNLLTEDNLPSYHRLIHNSFPQDSAWATWTNQWTGEEDNHAYVMRSYLDLTRTIDPYLLERERLAQMSQGYNVNKDPIHTLVYVTFQELATRVSHRNTGIAAEEPMADAMLQQIAGDENLHMLFYRNVVKQALDIAPNQVMQAIYDEITSFAMPGANIQGFKPKALRIAEAGIYDPRNHLEKVIMPVLKQWNIFQREDLTGYGAAARDQLGAFLAKLNISATRFEEQRDSRHLHNLIEKLESRSKRA